MFIEIAGWVLCEDFWISPITFCRRINLRTDKDFASDTVWSLSCRKNCVTWELFLLLVFIFFWAKMTLSHFAWVLLIRLLSQANEIVAKRFVKRDDLLRLISFPVQNDTCFLFLSEVEDYFSRFWLSIGSRKGEEYVMLSQYRIYSHFSIKNFAPNFQACGLHCA